MYTQKSKWAANSVVVTLFVVALFVALEVVSFLGAGLSAISFVLLGVLLAISLSALCFFPLETRVESDSLVIRFPLRRKAIPLARIKEVTPYQMPSNTFRLCGSGAFFGWWGWFSNRQLGHFMVYAANLDRLVLVKLCNGKKYVVSCSDPQAMTEAIAPNRR